jgi:hypothetical protein
VDWKIAVTWMRLDHSELHWLAAPRAGVVGKIGQRHGEFLFAPGELRTLKGVQPIDGEGLERFAVAPQSTPMMRPGRHVKCGSYASVDMSKTRYYQPSPFSPLDDPLSDTPADDPIERRDKYQT